MNYFGFSEKGPFRAENQDCFELHAVGAGVLGVVCDGMGGITGGRMASSLASGRFAAFAQASLEASDCDDPPNALRQAADAANRKVFRYSTQAEEYAGMGTTLVAGFWHRESAYFVNVGDSRAYRIAKDGILQITKDHSLVQQMVDQGEITSAQARVHPKRNIITRAVGSERFLSCDAYTLSLREGDRFLLCTDGLHNCLEEAELHRVLLAEDSAEEACRTLMKEAETAGARDNVTAIVYFA